MSLSYGVSYEFQLEDPVLVAALARVVEGSVVLNAGHSGSEGVWKLIACQLTNRVFARQTQLKWKESTWLLVSTRNDVGHFLVFPKPPGFTLHGSDTSHGLPAAGRLL